jgi:hypothetical protein
MTTQQRVDLMEYHSPQQVISLMRHGVSLEEVANQVGKPYSELYRIMKAYFSDSVRWKAFLKDCNEARQDAKREALITLFFKHRDRSGKFQPEWITKDPILVAEFQDRKALERSAKWLAARVHVPHIH